MSRHSLSSKGAETSDNAIVWSLAASVFLWLVPGGWLAGPVLAALITVVVARRLDLRVQSRFRIIVGAAVLLHLCFLTGIALQQLR